jgi:hypothetical protein
VRRSPGSISAKPSRSGSRLTVQTIRGLLAKGRVKAFDEDAKNANVTGVEVSGPVGTAAGAQAGSLTTMLPACNYFSNITLLPPTSGKKASLQNILLRYFAPVAATAPVIRQYSTRGLDDVHRRFSQAFAWKHVAKNAEHALTKAKERNIDIATFIPSKYATILGAEIKDLKAAGVYAAVVKWLRGQRKHLKTTGRWQRSCSTGASGCMASGALRARANSRWSPRTPRSCTR